MNCPVEEHTEFAAKLEARMTGRCVPLYGAFEITHRCNLKCVHCYIPSSLRHEAPSQKLLELAEIYSLLDDIASEGCIWLLITGGEPLLHPNFREIYYYAKRKGFITTLFTNGTLLTAEIADLLAANRPFLVEITLYGASPETYERITGNGCWFEKVLRGVDLLIERKIRVRLKTMVLSLNVHELEDMKRIAAERNLSFRWDGTIIARIDGDQHPCDLRLSAEDLVKLEMADPRRRAAWVDRVREGLVEAREALYKCQAGDTAFGFDGFGQLFLCLNSRVPSYDLRAGSFCEGYHHFLQEVRNRIPPADFPCRNCKFIRLCRYCPGRFLLETGDEFTPSKWYCDVGRQVWDALSDIGELCI
jgi:radical SAM protein with 4Fe4S-binding SPASM domain